MMTPSPDQLIQRNSKLDSYWATWRTTWECIAEYVMPSRLGFNSSWWPGQRRQKRVYDGFALEACVKLANNLHSLMTNPATTWAHLRFREEALRDSSEAREWLSLCEDAMFSALNDSNFATEVNEFYQDIVAFGMGCLHSEPLMPENRADDGEFHGLWFHAYHLSEINAAENSRGVIDTTFRTCKFTVQQAVEKFGLEELDDVRLGVSDKVRQLYEEGQLEAEHEYLHALYPRLLEEEKYPAEPKDRKFASTYIDIAQKKVVMEDGLYEQARFMPRWLGRSDDWGGYGPGERALPDIKTLNQARFLHLAAHEKMIDPPIKMKANNMIGDLHMQAKGITYLRNIDEARQWELRPDLNGALAELDIIKQNVREAFLWDALDLPRREDVGEMTAYEVAKRLEKAYQRLGPTVGRLQREFLDPMMQRVFAIMARRGALPAPPEIVLAMGGAAKVDVEYQSPLANAQRMEEVASADNWIGRIVGLAELDPSILDNIDFDEYAKVSGRNSGVPEEIMRNDADIESIRAERQKAMDQQAQLQQEQQGVDIIKGLGEAKQSGGLQLVEGQGG